MICGYSISSVVVLSLCWWSLMHWCCKFWLTYQFPVLLPVPLVAYLSHCLPQGHGDVLLYFYLLLFRPKWLTHLFVKIDVWEGVCAQGCHGSRGSLCLCGADFRLTWRRPEPSRLLVPEAGWHSACVCHISWRQQPPPAASSQSENVECWMKCIVVDKCVVDEKCQDGAKTLWGVPCGELACGLRYCRLWCSPGEPGLSATFVWLVGCGAALSPASEGLCRQLRSYPGAGSRRDGSTPFTFL